MKKQSKGSKLAGVQWVKWWAQSNNEAGIAYVDGTLSWVKFTGGDKSVEPITHQTAIMRSREMITAESSLHFDAHHDDAGERMFLDDLAALLGGGTTVDSSAEKRTVPVITATLRPGIFADFMSQAAERNCTPGEALRAFLETKDVLDCLSDWATKKRNNNN